LGAYNAFPAKISNDIHILWSDLFRLFVQYCTYEDFRPLELFVQGNLNERFLVTELNSFNMHNQRQSIICSVCRQQKALAAADYRFGLGEFPWITL